MMRIGIGFDVHKLVEGRPLILGGVQIPFSKGLYGHSDADVLIHAIGDAILGATGLGDIGRHFPDDDPQYKDIESLKILKRIYKLCEKKGFYCINIDATIVAQKPKLYKYVSKMEKNVALCLKIDKEVVNIKATTTEGLGFEGEGKGIAAYAVVLMERK